MDELRAYVDALFAHRGDTPENRDLKEEIYGNLAARRDDLIAQGVPAAEAVRAAKAQLPSLDGVLGTGVRVRARRGRLSGGVCTCGGVWHFVFAPPAGRSGGDHDRGHGAAAPGVPARVADLGRVFPCVRGRGERGAVCRQCVVFAAGAHRRAVCARRCGGAILSCAEHDRVPHRGRDISAPARAM